MSKHVNTYASGLFSGYITPLVAGNDLRVWMLVIPAGTFSARDGRGPFTTGDKQEMQAVIDRTRERIAKTELMIDYDHQAANLSETGQTAKAAGWIKQLEARDDGIWAEVEWTAPARAMIKANEYRYLSPLFAHDKSGKVQLILNVALVNMPALDLPAIAARTNFNNESLDMDKIAKALGLKNDASETAILTALSALTGFRANIITALGVKNDVTDNDLVVATTALAADHKKIAAFVGLATDASGDQVVAAATKLKPTSSSDPDPAKFVPIETVSALQSELKELKDTVEGGAAETAIDDAVKAGKLIPAQRDWGLKLFRSDKSAFHDYVNSAVILTAQQLSSGKQLDTQAITSLSSEQKAIATQLGLSHETYLKTLQDEHNEETAL